MNLTKCSAPLNPMRAADRRRSISRGQIDVPVVLVIVESIGNLGGGEK